MWQARLVTCFPSFDDCSIAFCERPLGGLNCFGYDDLYLKVYNGNILGTKKLREKQHIWPNSLFTSKIRLYFQICMMFWITLFPLTNLSQCTSWMSDLEWLQRLLALCTTQCSQRNMDRITCTAEACIICDMSQKHKITEMYKISFTTFDCLCDFFFIYSQNFSSLWVP